MKTSTRILVTILPLVFAFLAATVGITYYFSRTALTGLAETWLETRLSEAIRAINEQQHILNRYELGTIPASIAKAKMDAATAISHIDVGKQGFIFAVDMHGRIVMHSQQQLVGSDVSGQPWFQGLHRASNRLVISGPHKKSLAMVAYFAPWQWYIFAADPEAEVYGVVYRIRPYLFVLALVGGVLMTLALVRFSGRLTAPLRALTAGADRIGKGDLDTRISVTAHDEFGHLARVFNHMAGELRQSLTALRHREEYFRSLIENSSDIIMTLDADGFITYTSPSIERIMGYPAMQLIARQVFDFIHPGDKERIRRLFQRRIKSATSGPAVTARFRHQKGHWLTLEATGRNLLRHPAVSGIVVNSRDITFRKMAQEALEQSHRQLEQRVAERTSELMAANERLQQESSERQQAVEALRASEQRMKAILRASPVGICLSIERKIMWANEAMIGMLGYEKEELVGKPARELYAQPEGYERGGRDLYGKECAAEIGQMESQLVRKDGTVFDCLLRAYPLDPEDRSKGTIVAVADISESKRLQAELQRAKKMEAIGTLAGGVAHDLNNILSGIVSYPELLLLETPVDSPLRKPLLTIKQSGDKAATIVQDLLTMARRGVAVTEVVNLNQIVSEVINSPEIDLLRSYHPNITISTNLAADLCSIKGSSAHLSKSIMNLASNAAESMPQGGCVLISTQNIYIDRNIKSYEHIAQGDYVTLQVSDTGVGISETDMERIFEPFYTKKKMGRSGTGLGMAVVWGTVKDHGGHIDIQSREGQGTTLTLFFPVTDEQPADTKTAVPEAAYRGAGESVLIVDDSKVQREVASTILEHLGYKALMADSGEAAVAFIRRQPVDLILLDMIMEPGIDGLETYRRIIEIQPRQKAIIASGYSETERVREAQRLGAGQHVKKPYSIETIGLAVKKALQVPA